MFINSFPDNQPFPYEPYSKTNQKFVRVINWNYNPYEVHNRIMGRYYNRTCFQAIPSSIYKRYKSNDFTNGLTALNYKTKDKNILIMEDHQENTWIIPIAIKQAIINTEITFIENIKKEKLQFHQLIIRKLLGTLETSQIRKTHGKSLFISQNDSCYIITEAKPTAQEIIVKVTNSDNQNYNIHFYKK